MRVRPYKVVGQSHRFDHSALAGGRCRLSERHETSSCLCGFSALIAALAVAPTATAQVLPDPHADPHESLVKPPDELPNIPKGERNRTSISCLARSKLRPDDTSAKEIENRIWSLWTEANNETTKPVDGPRQEGGGRQGL